MAIENGEWVMRGLSWADPSRLKTWQDLVSWVDEVGFLPLFKNEVAGFSVEEHTAEPVLVDWGRTARPLGVAAAHRPQRPGGLRQVL